VLKIMSLLGFLKVQIKKLSCFLDVKDSGKGLLGADHFNDVTAMSGQESLM
jgi:hypothetical protein